MLENTQHSPAFTRRERQIMDVLYALGRATGPEIQERLPDAPSYSTVRTLLRVLEQKGHVHHVEENLRYVYVPNVAPEEAKKSALDRILRTFFQGSARQAVATLLDPKAFPLSAADLDELTLLIEKARREAP